MTPAREFARAPASRTQPAPLPRARCRAQRDRPRAKLPARRRGHTARRPGAIGNKDPAADGPDCEKYRKGDQPAPGTGKDTGRDSSPDEKVTLRRCPALRPATREKLGWAAVICSRRSRSSAAHPEFFPRVAGRSAGHRRSADLARRANCHDRVLACAAGWLIALRYFSQSGPSAAGSLFQLPWSAALYVLYAVLAIWLGDGSRLRSASSAWQRCCCVSARRRPREFLAGVIQFYGTQAAEDVVAELHGNRAYGISRNQLYANYLALAKARCFSCGPHPRANGVRASRPGYPLLGSALSAPVRPAYALWYAGLGLVAARIQNGAEERRLRFAAYASRLRRYPRTLPCRAQRRTASRSPGEARSSAYCSPRRACRTARAGLAHCVTRVCRRSLAGVGVGEFAGPRSSRASIPRSRGSASLDFTAQSP